MARSNTVVATSPKNPALKADTPRAKASRNDEEYHETKRVTRGSTKISKENFVGKLIWGCCSGWWPALIIDADHVGMLSEAGKLWVYWIGEARISLLNEKTQIEPFSCNVKHRLEQHQNVARMRAIDATMQMLRRYLGSTLTKPYWRWIANNFSDTTVSVDEVVFYPFPPKIEQRLAHLKAMNAKATEKFLLGQKRQSQPKKTIEKPKESPQQTNTDLTRLPLREQNPGVITWAKIAGHNWWPAMIIDYRDCCMREPSFGCQWIMWYGDYKLSEIHHQCFLRFEMGLEKMRDYVNKTKKHLFLVGVLQASKDYCSRMGFETDNWTMADVFKYFSEMDRLQPQPNPLRSPESVRIYDKYSTRIVKMLNELKNDPNVDDKRAYDIQNSDDLRSVTSGEASLESLCLKCLKISRGPMQSHPFFEGSLCDPCSEQYKPCMFVFGNDGKCFYCTICAATGTVIICDNEDCPRVYCTACMKHLLCPATYEQVLLEDPWECFLCKVRSGSVPDIVARPRSNWKDKIIDMFRTSCNSSTTVTNKHTDNKRRIRVLSLFDGLSTGMLVLHKLGLEVDTYYASEIDPDALMVSAMHFGSHIVQLGDVRNIKKKKIKEMVPIDLLIGGSPCNDLSLVNPARLGLHDPRGTGILFFEYWRLLKLVKKLNSGRHLFWLYENVASMPSVYRLEINKYLGQEPDVIDSADFSPQHRLRLYWHNLPFERYSLPFQGDTDVQDILTPHCQRYALVKKIRTVTTKVNSLKQGKTALKPILMNDQSDSLWITELEEIFGFPRHYTDVKNLSATKRQRLIGKSWSVQTLTAMFKSLCPYFVCSTTPSAQLPSTSEKR
ncbi:DNA (cytosine-5)-methyltransferase 3C-like isoform X1 [Halictus rubicundus]|uniref:DNA (cytosine-5)-methyltransferase 3C-like isoform X1 n=2 Tax=Halictus rubicundus TaxID=77578 RepID=UPI004036C3A1